MMWLRLVPIVLTLCSFALAGELTSSQLLEQSHREIQENAKIIKDLEKNVQTLNKLVAEVESRQLANSKRSAFFQSYVTRIATLILWIAIGTGAVVLMVAGSIVYYFAYIHE